MSSKVLFLLGDCPGNYVPLMYKLAQSLVDTGSKVLVASTSPYYEAYTGVDFSSLGEVHYLSKFLEKKIDQSVLDSVELDYWNAYPTYVRDYYFIGRHRNNWNVYKKTALFFEEIFKDHKIDLVVSEPPSNSFLYIGYTQAQKNGSKFMGFMSARIPKHINVFLDPFGQQLLTKPPEKQLLSSFAEGPPDYMLRRKSKLIRGGGLTQIRSFFRYSVIRSVETSSTPIHQLRALYKKYIWRQIRYIRVKLANIFVNDFRSDDKINILFPLHLRPEASTSVLSKYYENDLELLKNIAFSLPNNARLIVKEHKPALGIRSIAFYKKALSLPNTVLLHPDYDLASNIKKFDAAVVLTSTVGFEAIKAGVPVLLLGRTFYSNYPGVVNIESYVELENRLKSLNKNTARPNDSVMPRYLKKCFPGQFNYMDDDVVLADNIDKLIVPIRQLLDAKENREAEFND